MNTNLNIFMQITKNLLSAPVYIKSDISSCQLIIVKFPSSDDGKVSNKQYSSPTSTLPRLGWLSAQLDQIKCSKETQFGVEWVAVRGWECVTRRWWWLSPAVGWVVGLTPLHWLHRQNLLTHKWNSQWVARILGSIVSVRAVFRATVKSTSVRADWECGPG